MGKGAFQGLPVRPSTDETCCPHFSWTEPGRHEAVTLIFASLMACTFFWCLGAIDAMQEPTSAILATALESMFDVVSTLIVLWRLRRLDALDETPASVQSEQRTSAVLSICTCGIASVLIGFAAYQLGKDDEQVVDRRRLRDTIALSFPSAIVYLIIGMLQINLGLMMRVRSIRQDGVISILAAAVGLGALLAALINLMTCEYKEYLDLPDDFKGELHRNKPLTGAALLRAIREHSMDDSDGIRIELNHDIKYPFYWVEDVITISLAVVILTLGLRTLAEDARAGIKWWRPSFWTEPPPEKAVCYPVPATHTSDERRSSEKTPLRHCESA